MKNKKVIVETITAFVITAGGVILTAQANADTLTVGHAIGALITGSIAAAKDLRSQYTDRPLRKGEMK